MPGCCLFDGLPGGLERFHTRTEGESDEKPNGRCGACGGMCVGARWCGARLCATGCHSDGCACGDGDGCCVVDAGGGFAAAVGGARASRSEAWYCLIDTSQRYAYCDVSVFGDAADVESDVFGFAGGNRGTGEGAVLDNNVTASLWIGIREGALTPEQFVNPNVMTAEMDEVTLDGRPGTRQLQVREVYDFARAENLSYSVMNMYHEAVGQNWSAVVHPEYVMMGDNNNSDWLGSPGRHTNTSDTGLTDQQVMDAENSRNHGGEGQNFMFGDGHVAWHTDPFVGIGNDNVYAQDMAAGSDSDPFPDEVAAPPTLGNQRDDPDTYTRTVRERDSFLLPITGNGGGAGSLDPLD